MEKSAFCLLSILIGIAFVFNPTNLLSAEKPEVLIDLKFSKKAYMFGEPIAAKVGIQNRSGRGLLLSRGFGDLDFFLEMRIIDPAGELVLARRNEPHDEFPDAPPLPFVLHDNKPVRAVPCEVLRSGAKRILKSDDLRDHYALERPGNYSAQVQISVAIFKGEPCHTRNYRWLGVIKSNTVNFYIEPGGKKRKTAQRPSPIRNFTIKKNSTDGGESRQNAFDQSLKPVAYHQPGPVFVDPNPDMSLASPESGPLFAYNHKSFSIKLTGGSGIPTADMMVPAQTVDVPINTAIEIDVSNAGSRTISEIDTEARFAVDSWYRDNGEMPFIQPIADWRRKRDFPAAYNPELASN